MVLSLAWLWFENVRLGANKYVLEWGYVEDKTMFGF